MRAVLDSSALLALLLDEPGAEALDHPLPEWHLSTVNYAETLARMIDLGFPETRCADIISDVVMEIPPFSQSQGTRSPLPQHRLRP